MAVLQRASPRSRGFRRADVDSLSACGSDRAGDRRLVAALHPVEPVGHAVAHAIALDQLRLRQDVIVGCVNPSALRRDAWVGLAVAAAGLVEVETICPDRDEHRRGVEGRPTDVLGLLKPDCDVVAGRGYECWTRQHLSIDSVAASQQVPVGRIIAAVDAAADHCEGRPVGRLPQSRLLYRWQSSLSAPAPRSACVGREGVVTRQLIHSGVVDARCAQSWDQAGDQVGVPTRGPAARLGRIKPAGIVAQQQL